MEKGLCAGEGEGGPGLRANGAGIDWAKARAGVTRAASAAG